eukprot:1143014-Pelagomonas_calceolata.AAC.1
MLGATVKTNEGLAGYQPCKRGYRSKEGLQSKRLTASLLKKKEVAHVKSHLRRRVGEKKEKKEKEKSMLATRPRAFRKGSLPSKLERVSPKKGGRKGGKGQRTRKHTQARGDYRRNDIIPRSLLNIESMDTKTKSGQAACKVLSPGVGIWAECKENAKHVCSWSGEHTSDDK